ncbi:hypothetical protein VTN00DRAFT_9318 [Thermoascus crustaceus]|uniref:uncharacterized protein n=1 Tax=Thermoascus crustaceus TaxID=5088 RepID=UPI0037443DCE
MVMVIYFHPFTVHKLPPKEVIVSVFLPMGPLGQGGFGIMKLGAAAQVVFPQTHTLERSAGSTFCIMGFLTALILWPLSSRGSSLPPRRLFDILSISVVILWIVVAIGTAKGAISGKLFYAPCLAYLSNRHAEQKDVAKAA